MNENLDKPLVANTACWAPLVPIEKTETQRGGVQPKISHLLFQSMLFSG